MKQSKRTGAGRGRTGKRETLDLDAHLPYRLARLSNLIRQTTSDVYLKHTGMSGREWRVLGMIGLRGPLSAAETAELTGMDRATITRSVDRLEALGYVERAPDAHDRRRIVLAVTPLGRRRCDRIIPMMREDGTYYETVLTAREQQQLLDMIERLETQARERMTTLAGERGAGRGRAGGG